MREMLWILERVTLGIIEYLGITEVQFEEALSDWRHGAGRQLWKVEYLAIFGLYDVLENRMLRGEL